MKSQVTMRKFFLSFDAAPSKKTWITVAVVFWLYFVVSHIPAVWGAYLMTRNGDLAMSGVSGSIWSGRASLASVKIKEMDYSFGQLTWKLDITSLLLLKPCALIATGMDNQQFDGHVCMGRNGLIAVTDAKIIFPTSLIQPLLPLPIDGQLLINIDQLTLQQAKLSNLKAKLSWMGGKIYNGSNWMMLGSYGADLVDDKKFGLSAHIVDVSSPVRAELILTLLSPAGGSLKGNLSMPEAFSREVNAGAWLTMFASQNPPDAEGNLIYTVDLNL